MVGVGLLGALVACQTPSASGDGSAMGSSSSGASGTQTGGTIGADTTASASSDGEILDVGKGPVGCIECSLTISSMQSGIFEVLSDDIFATATLEGQTVYAVGELGNGRFIATADSSLPLNEQTDCPLLAWLAATHDPDPSILVFGWDRNVELGDREFQPTLHMPEAYVGDAEALAADYDVVVYLEESFYLDDGDTPTNLELQTAYDFMAIHGGGLVVSSEYAEPGGGYLTPADLASVNRLLLPLGLEAQQVNLSWGDVVGGIEFPCFPPVG
ncbi:MAG: hypothetical protein K0V04_04485 [Deltaproteobacteria bacterium]|nr:hypothetical protein [Deltaproteobacteria bacterium]